MKSPRISAGTMMVSRFPLTSSVILTTRPRLFSLRSRKKILRSARIFSVCNTSCSIVFVPKVWFGPDEVNGNLGLEELGEAAEEAGIFRWQVRCGIVVVKKLLADGEEFIGRFDPTNLVLKFFGVPLNDVGEILLHLLNMFQLMELGSFPGDFVVEKIDVFKDHPSGDCGDGLLCQRGSELGKNPGMPDGSASNHQSGRLCSLQIVQPGCDVDDIAIGNHRTGK